MSRLVGTTGELEKVCDGLRAGGAVALDTEFVWMRTYYPVMGIVQLAGAGVEGDGVVFDCRAGADPGALADLLEDAGTVKILHAAQQDLEHLHGFCGACPKNVFDTRVAAGFCGLGAGLGLAKLVQAVLGVELPKTETRTDWTQRPLTDAQLRYALDDVAYLAELREWLLARSKELGTQEWLLEEMGRFDEEEQYGGGAPGGAWRRMKGGARRLPRRGLAVLRELAATRERLARAWDLPRAWVTDDGSLLSLAAHGAGTPLVAGAMRFRHRLRRREKVRELAEAYEKAAWAAWKAPEQDWPAALEASPQEPEGLTEAMAWLEKLGRETGLDAGLVASKAVLSAFLAGRPEGAPLAKGWRWKVAGEEVCRRWGGGKQ